jgi:hypothetical protein
MAAPKTELTPTQPSLTRKAFGQLFAPAKLLREQKIRRVLYAAGLTAAAVGLCAAIWRNIREDVYALPEYQVPVAELHVTPAPAWLHPRANIRNEVVRDASLAGNMSLLNERLTVDVARAFALHPWVDEVVGVKKSFPARLDVELKYRRPMCLVALPDETYVVDARGVLLPRDDIPAAEMATLPRLTGVDAPTSLVGAAWGDVRVTDGAAIAEALREDWPTLGLREIVPDKPVSTVRGSRYRYFLTTTQGRLIEWGYSPAAEISDEADLSTKLSRLRNAQRGQTAPVRSDGTPVMEPTRRTEDLTRLNDASDSR